jgi:hypothetical protein
MRLLLFGVCKSNKEMDERQKTERKRKKQTKRNGRISNALKLFSSKIYERQDDKNKVEAFKIIHVLLFPGKLAKKKKLQILVFFDVRFLFLVVPSLLTYSNVFIV